MPTALLLLQYLPAIIKTISELTGFVNRSIDHLKQNTELDAAGRAKLDAVINSYQSVLTKPEHWKTDAERAANP